jgi:hypothetical protein
MKIIEERYQSEISSSQLKSLSSPTPWGDLASEDE